MKAKDLSKIWLEPDSKRLSKQQIAVRLPLSVLAGITAIEVIFPQKNKTEIIGDLLSAALDDFAESLPDEEPSEADRAQAERDGTNAMSQKHAYEFIKRTRLSYLEGREFGEPFESRIAKPWVEFRRVERNVSGQMRDMKRAPDYMPKTTANPITPDKEAEAPRRGGATAQSTEKGRTAEGPRGDQRSRKRGGRRRPANG